MTFLSHSGPITAAQARRERKKLVASMAADLRKKDRAHLKKLRETIVAKKAERRERLKTLRKLCRDGIREARERAKAERAALRERQREERREAREQAKRDREEANAVCASRSAVDASARAEIAAAEESYDAERARVREEHAGSYHRPERMTRAEAARARSEARAESDDEVRNNIPSELVPVWERVKAGIHETPRMTRTEAFLQWAHDHSADVERLIDDSITESLRRLEREEREHHRAMRRPARYRRTPAHLAADIDAHRAREPGEDDEADVEPDVAGVEEVPF